MRFLMLVLKILFLPLGLLFLLFVIHSNRRYEPEMFDNGQPSQKWLLWYRCKHFTSEHNAKAAFVTLNTKMDEPSYFNDHEAWFKWVEQQSKNVGMSEVRRTITIRLAARWMEIRRTAVAALGKTEPETIISENKDAINLEWVDYHSSVKGMSVEAILLKEIQRQVHDHNRFINDVYITA